MKKIFLIAGIVSSSMIFSCSNSGKENQKESQNASDESAMESEDEGIHSDEVTGNGMDSISVGASKEDKIEHEKATENNKEDMGGFSGKAGAEDTSSSK